MHIAIDATPLSSGHSGRGVGVYTKNLIDSLKRYEKHHSYTLFTRKQKVPNSADIVHYPYFDPFFLTLPVRKHKPTIVTVHDLIPLVFPDKFLPGFRGSLTWTFQKMSLLGARRVIADSNTSKDDVVRITGFSRNKIDTVYLAPSESSGKITQKDILERVKKQYLLPDRFILSVSDVNWNKNISGLLKTFFHIISRDRRLKLVLVGKAFLDSALVETQEINRLIAELNLEPYIIRTGYVGDRELMVFYTLAGCLVQLSHYEGFGLPVLEAMKCGCPVVVSDTSSLTEISGPSVRVQLENARGVISGILKVLDMSDVKRRQLVDQGYAWVSQFTWQKTAKETVQSYERTLL